MKKITLQPVIKFLDSLNRDYVFFNEFQQLEQKIINRREQNLAVTGHTDSVETDTRYLEIIQKLKSQFAGQKKISCAQVLTGLSKILVTENWTYKKARHKSKHKNIFRRDSSINDYYDVAFYNKAHTRNRGRSHYQHRGMSSVIYARCEEFPDEPEKILIGNLQKDTRQTGWTEPGIGKILQQPKNLERELIQQVVKHALGKKKTKILFQAGDAVQLAQWDAVKIKKIVINEKNYPQYLKNYQKKLKQFAKLSVGDEFNYPDEEIVYEKTGDYFKTYYAPKVMDSAIKFLLKTIPEQKNDTLLRSALAGRWSGIGLAIAQDNEELLFERFNNLLEDLGIAPQARRDRREKIKYLAQIARTWRAQEQGTDNTTTTLMPRLEKYLEKFNYHQALCAAWPHMRMVAWGGKNHYLDLTIAHNICTFYREKLFRPELGKTYYKEVNVFNYNRIYQDYHYRRENFKDRIFFWYEKRLPKILKSLGLTCRRVPIVTTRSSDSKKVEAHAWEIIAGLERFEQRPLTRF